MSRSRCENEGSLLTGCRYGSCGRFGFLFFRPSMLIRNTLPLLGIPRVQFILPFARLEGILFRVHLRLRLMMEGLTKPIGVAARSPSRRRKSYKKPCNDDRRPETLPHSQSP